MKYWVSFGAFQMFEMIADVTVAFILPFYIEIKILSILWMVLGTKLIFDTIVNRELSRREKSIDRWLKKASKCRDEMLAILWMEFSQCSIKILSALASGGMSVLLVKTPETSNQTSPVCSDAEEADQPDVIMIDDDVQDTEVQERPCVVVRPRYSRLSRTRVTPLYLDEQ